MVTKKLLGHTPYNSKGEATEDPRMNLPRRYPNMRYVALTDAGEELIGLRPTGANGGETYEDEIKVVGPASARMLVTLALLNRFKSKGKVSPIDTGR